MWETIFFWIFAVGALLSSLAVVLIPRNPLYNALALILDFFFFAGLYGLLSAHFLAVVQVLVYGGAIMVLFMFIIMLLNIRDDEKMAIKINVHQVIGIVAAFAFLGILVASFQNLMDSEKVSSGVAAYQQSIEKEHDVPHSLDIPSNVPGLSLDINEAGINQRYDATMEAYADGSLRPSDGNLVPTYSGVLPKYREFDRSEKIVVPQELLPKHDNDVANRDPSSFGTIQPLSVLLVNRFVIPFELTAILLLAAVIGAFIIAKKRL